MKNFGIIYKNRLIICAILLIWTNVSLCGQVESDEKALIDIKNGISISKQDIFLLNLRFRMQNRMGFTTVSNQPFKVESFEARVRRLRLRFDGFVGNRNLQYYIQLSFSRADQDLETGTIAQIIRDAIIYYNFSPNFYIGFGQSKLPGNRQRVVSSGNLQFTDRSIANATYNIDRDFGLFAYYNFNAGLPVFRTKFAITSGDGRNAIAINNGLAYTGRLEILPFGIFSDNGDYSEGDQERESTPKLAIATTLSYNDKASRLSGQRGSTLLESRDLTTFEADFVFKYMGWAWTGEWFQLNASDPFVRDPETMVARQFIQEGKGINSQLSYLFKSNVEVAVRYARVQPSPEMKHIHPVRQEYLAGSTYYFNKHRIKFQLNVGKYFDNYSDLSIQSDRDRWVILTQVEFGI